MMLDEHHLKYKNEILYNQIKRKRKNGNIKYFGIKINQGFD